MRVFKPDPEAETSFREAMASPHFALTLQERRRIADLKKQIAARENEADAREAAREQEMRERRRRGAEANRQKFLEQVRLMKEALYAVLAGRLFNKTHRDEQARIRYNAIKTYEKDNKVQPSQRAVRKAVAEVKEEEQ